MRRSARTTPAEEQEVSPEVSATRRSSRVVSRVLAAGVASSILLLIAGAVLALAGRGPSPSEVTAIGDMPRALAAFEPGGFLDLGLLVLLATPVAGVVTLAAGFARAKSWFFCGVCAAVLGLVALSAYLGVRG